MLKLLIGGSPCTHWSIAQTKNRETKPEGLGWELFLNYLMALEKYRPDYFLYENNKSMATAIRAEITRQFGFEPVLINSALVSAQNRQRLYWVGKRNLDGTYSRVDVEQPEDRGILLREVLETGMVWREKAYTFKANYAKASIASALDGGHFPAPMKAEPVAIGYRNRREADAKLYRRFEGGESQKGNALTCHLTDCMVAVPIRIGIIEGAKETGMDYSKQYKVYSTDGKATALCGNGGGAGARTGLYAAPVMRIPEATKQGYCDIAPGECVDLAMEHSKTRQGRKMAEKSNCLTTSCTMCEYCGTIDKPIYKVEDGHITIKGKKYPIKLRDGCYIIRKLTVTECKRLQTVPDGYVFPVSDTQACKMLGNGWTVDVIAHIMRHFEGLTTEPMEVLSMYDGMSCGHIALDKLGARVARYYATEIDKYAIQTTQANYPDTVQLGDAFQVRADGWRLPEPPGKKKAALGGGPECGRRRYGATFEVGPRKKKGAKAGAV